MGYLPLAPGTWGSLAGAAVWWFLLPAGPTLQITLLLIAIVAGTWAASVMINSTGQNDPAIVVVDEVAGMWVALLAAPKEPIYFAAAFLLFRLFDIWKPWPISKAEEAPSGYGVMLDDLLAGLITLVLLKMGYAWL